MQLDSHGWEYFSTQTLQAKGKTSSWAAALEEGRVQDMQSLAGEKVIYIHLGRHFRNNVVESHGRPIPFSHENTSRMALNEKEAYDFL